MAEDLGVTSHPHSQSAIAVLERAVDALRCGSLVVTDGFGGFVTGAPSGQFPAWALRPRRGLASMMGAYPGARLLSQISGAS